MNGSERILAVAAREIGYREGAGKHTKYGDWYGLNDNWCMIFVQWVYAQAGMPLPFRTASCGSLLRCYREHQPDCVKKTPVPGCIVIFDFPGTAYDTDHTGLYVTSTELKLTTIDGNTSNESDASGGWVQQRTRSLAYANPTYIVPRELVSGEEKEKRWQTLEEIRAGAPWAAETVRKLTAMGALNGTGDGLDLSGDMLRILVIADRAGAFGR